MISDHGTWEPEVPDVDAALRKGNLKFTLHGKNLEGSWVLVYTRGFGSSKSRFAWLLIKHRDAFSSDTNITLDEPYSVVSHRLPSLLLDGG